MRPPVAVACNLNPDGSTNAVCVLVTYTDALLAGGMAPFVVPATTDEEVLNRYLDMAGGLFLPGGIDVWPMMFKAEPDPNIGRLDPSLDLYQAALLKLARQRKMPVLAVCRGLQLMNVVFGGTLNQHVFNDKAILAHRQTMNGRWPQHEAVAEKGSLIEKIFGSEPFGVNSFHHQAVGVVAPGLNVTARATDGIVEAMETNDGTYCVGVQWHPERMVNNADGASLALFRSFADAAAGYLERR